MKTLLGQKQPGELCDEHGVPFERREGFSFDISVCPQCAAAASEAAWDEFFNQPAGVSLQ